MFASYIWFIFSHKKVNWRKSPLYGVVVITFDGGETLASILVTTSNFCTDEGIKVGSRVNDVYVVIIN